MEREFKSRTTEEARKALSNFCKGVGTAGDRHVHIFTIPVDNDRDCDVILSDVITERDRLKQALYEHLPGNCRCEMNDGKTSCAAFKLIEGYTPVTV